MKFELEEMKKLMERGDEASQLEHREISLLLEKQKQRELEAKQEKQQKRELAKEDKRTCQIEKSKSRQDDFAEVLGAWNALFGRDYAGRGFLERLGAFAFKYIITYAFTWWPLMFLASGFIFDHPKEKLLLLGLSIFFHLLAFFFGVRGWLGYTKLARHHQRFWGVCAAIFMAFTIGSIFVDTSFVKWLFLRPE